MSMKDFKQSNVLKPVDPRKIKLKKRLNKSLENGTIDVDDSVSDEQLKHIKTTD